MEKRLWHYIFPEEWQPVASFFFENSKVIDQATIFHVCFGSIWSRRRKREPLVLWIGSSSCHTKSHWIVDCRHFVYGTVLNRRKKVVVAIEMYIPIYTCWKGILNRAPPFFLPYRRVLSDETAYHSARPFFNANFAAIALFPLCSFVFWLFQSYVYMRQYTRGCMYV